MTRTTINVLGVLSGAAENCERSGRICKAPSVGALLVWPTILSSDITGPRKGVI
jgi:hypothetical protein